MESDKLIIKEIKLNKTHTPYTDLEGANKAILIVNNALERVSEERAKYGAMQNRLEHTINNLRVSEENLQAAESRIRDADYWV
jgi:flagellin